MNKNMLNQSKRKKKRAHRGACSVAQRGTLSECAVWYWDGCSAGEAKSEAIYKTSVVWLAAKVWLQNSVAA
jgi:hypothetical protein